MNDSLNRAHDAALVALSDAAKAYKEAKRRYDAARKAQAILYRALQTKPK